MLFWGKFEIGKAGIFLLSDEIKRPSDTIIEDWFTDRIFGGWIPKEFCGIGIFFEFSIMFELFIELGAFFGIFDDNSFILIFSSSDDLE